MQKKEKDAIEKSIAIEFLIEVEHPQSLFPVPLQLSPCH